MGVSIVRTGKGSGGSFLLSEMLLAAHYILKRKKKCDTYVGGRAAFHYRCGLQHALFDSKISVYAR